MKLMKWRVAERKLNFVNKIMARENSNITMSEVLLEDMQNVTIKGLAHECKSLSEELSIPNGVFNRVNKSTIKQATEAIDKKEKRIDMENSKKVGDRLTDNPKDNTYLSDMSLLRSRIWIRHRVRMLKGVKYGLLSNLHLFLSNLHLFCVAQKVVKSAPFLPTKKLSNLHLFHHKIA